MSIKEHATFEFLNSVIEDNNRELLIEKIPGVLIQLDIIKELTSKEKQLKEWLEKAVNKVGVIDTPMFEITQKFNKIMKTRNFTDLLGSIKEEDLNEKQKIELEKLNNEIKVEQEKALNKKISSKKIEKLKKIIPAQMNETDNPNIEIKEQLSIKGKEELYKGEVKPTNNLVN